MAQKEEFRSFPAVSDSLPPIREFIAGFGGPAGLDRAQLYKLCLAVDEIATNIINHGYLEAGITGGTIDVSLSADEKRLKVAIEDTALPFNPLEFNVPGEDLLSRPLEERPIGGLGIMLARENVDEYRYDYKDGKNHNVFIMILK